MKFITDFVDAIKKGDPSSIAFLILLLITIGLTVKHFTIDKKENYFQYEEDPAYRKLEFVKSSIPYM